jgi:hypothetical protein
VRFRDFGFTSFGELAECFESVQGCRAEAAIKEEILVRLAFLFANRTSGQPLRGKLMVFNANFLFSLLMDIVC